MSYVIKRIRLVVPSNKAKPSPQIGQALGSLGINMMKFCKEFNATTTKYADDLPMRVKLYSYNDGSYNFTTHLPQTSWFIKKSCAGEVLKGANSPGHEEIGMVHVTQLFEIAKLKSTDSEDLSLVSLPNLFKTVVHQCKGMGIKVDYRNEEDFKEEARKLEPKKTVVAAAAAPKKKK